MANAVKVLNKQLAIIMISSVGYFFFFFTNYSIVGVKIVLAINHLNLASHFCVFQVPLSNNRWNW
jgi:hypothetical protein